jgi:hypothetical protein
LSTISSREGERNEIMTRDHIGGRIIVAMLGAGMWLGAMAPPAHAQVPEWIR